LKAPVCKNKQEDTIWQKNKEKELLSLYNALNETNYTDPEQIEIVTLENAVYMNMKNDLAFVMMFELNLYEHQSTFSPNMPLRDLFYISKELQGMIETKYLYGTKALQIPTPRFVVLYNGIQEQPERCVLKLSDLFQHPTADPELELKVTVLNINPGMNEGLMEKCKTLHEYMLFVERVRTYAKKMPLQEAVVRAVDECIREDILADFLRKNRNEAIEMCIFEYDEEEVMEVIREEQYQRGKEIGIEIGVEIGVEKGEKIGYEKGEMESELGSIRNMMKNLGWSMEKCMDILEIPDQVRDVYIKKLEQERL